MSFRQEMVRRNLLANRNQAKEAAKSTMFTAIPMVKIQSKALSPVSSTTLLQQIKEGKDLEHLSGVMDIRLLKSFPKSDTLSESSQRNHASAVNCIDAASEIVTPVATLDKPAPVSSDYLNKKLRLKSMHDLLEVFPDKSCEEFLYDCIPQFLTTLSKDSANYFQRRNESTLSEVRFQFADVFSDYPAEKRSVDFYLKSAAESGDFQNDIASSISLKTTKPAASLITDMKFEHENASLVVKSLEEASFALQPALSRLVSCDPATMQKIACFEAIEQHQWWCTASRFSNTATSTLTRNDVEDSSTNLEIAKSDDVDASDESQIGKLISVNPTSQLSVKMLAEELMESPQVHACATESHVGTAQSALSAEELAQEEVVAGLYAEACRALCTPIIDWLHKHPFVAVVDVSHMSLCNNGISSLAVIIMNSSRIELLDVCHDGISHVGMKHLCSSLLESKTIREVRLDCNPLGYKGAIQLSGALCCNRLNTSIETLSLSNCKLGDDGCAAIFKCLLGAVKMKSLNLSLNGADIETAKAAADVLPLITGLERLSLRWNAFKGSAAVVFCQGAMNNRSITDMDLSCNSFGDVDSVSHLGEAIKAMNHLKILDLSYNKIDGRGAYILGSALEINHHISNCNFSGNHIGMLGARVFSQLVLAAGLEQSSKRGRKITLENCNIQFVDVSLFDPFKPNGKYELDLSDYYSRIVIDSILRMRDLNQGEILEGSIKFNGSSISKITWKEDTIPQSGFLQFQFESFDHFPPKSEDCLSSKQILSIKELLRPCSDEKQKLSIFAMLTGHQDYFSLDQVREIMDMFTDSANRVALILLLSFQIAPVQNKSLLEQMLTSDDFQSKSIQGLSNFVRDFTILNPTGHYRLILDCDDDRRLMDLLLKVRSNVKRHKKNSFALQKHVLIENTCKDLEWCILNTKWNGKDFPVRTGWMCPSHGVLDFDFTAQLPPTKLLVDHDDFCIQMSRCNNDTERFALLRQLSNTFSFSTRTALLFLQTILSQEILENCIVALFDSIYEIAGFQFILSGVGPSIRDNVIRSLGIHNCLCSACIVAYHVLDLSDAGHRFVCQQLIALSFIEPGESMVDVHYDNQEFTIPLHWREALPFHGICSFFYCRDHVVLDEYYSNFGERALDHSLWKALQPAGVDWVHARKRGNIKDRIREKFPNPETAFQTMDRDGGGSISRVELSTELRKLGIWLQPHELEHLMSILDEDNGGTIEKEEFVNFWNSC